MSRRKKIFIFILAPIFIVCSVSLFIAVRNTDPSTGLIKKSSEVLRSIYLFSEEDTVGLQDNLDKKYLEILGSMFENSNIHAFEAEEMDDGSVRITFTYRKNIRA